MERAAFLNVCVMVLSLAEIITVPILSGSGGIFFS